MHSAAYSLASTTLTGLGLSYTLSRASTHFLEGPGPQTKILEGGDGTSCSGLHGSYSSDQSCLCSWFSFEKVMKLNVYLKSEFIV